MRTPRHAPGLQLLGSYSPDSAEFRQLVGRWGEELVWRALQAECGAQPELAGWSAVWVNQEGESLQPFDVVLR